MMSESSPNVPSNEVAPAPPIQQEHGDVRPAPSRRYCLITPCRNEAEYIRSTLETTTQQSVPPGVWSLYDSRVTRPRSISSTRSVSSSVAQRSCRTCSSTFGPGTPASSASTSRSSIRRLRRPGSQLSVAERYEVVMPDPSSWSALSAMAMPRSTATPPRGITDRSNASPCRSTRPGSTRQPVASMTSASVGAAAPRPTSRSPCHTTSPRAGEAASDHKT